MRTTLLALSVLMGCQGVIGSDPDDAGDNVPDIGEAPATGMPSFHFEPEGEDLRPGVRRLTLRQLAAAYEHISGVAPDFSALPADRPLRSLDNDATQLAIRDAAYLQTLMRQATQVASAADLGEVFPCEGGCTEEEVRAFMEHAFMRPLSDEEFTPYIELFMDASARFDRDFGRQALMQTVLIDPAVLYRTEIGESGILTPFELAEKLSYFLWGTPPDAELEALAFDGTLGDAEVYRAQVERMLADAQTRGRMQTFIADWLGLDDFDVADRQGSMDLSPAIQASMEREVEMLIDHALFDEATGIRGLMLSETTFVDALLAEHYGLEAPAAEGFVAVSLEGTERLGLLTTALVLAAHAKEGGRSPMQRGRFIVDELLCYGFPPDAGPAAMTLPPDTTDLTFREKFETLELRRPCNSCHNMINVGFAFDVFDNVGRRWPEEFAPATEAIGGFDLAPYAPFLFSSTRDAVEGLAVHPALARCYSAQILRYAQGTMPSEDDAPLLTELEEHFDRSGGEVLESLRLILNSQRFAAAAD